ncbi:GDP-mannose 4,6-dehydratase [Candidatus Daviesbacteria bacterium]|nr:GDP-mannose 4,6-dehydratase [Candidatus Daviesbacteria bacterium]
MKCLVTGGAGFIGSHIQDKLIELGHEVVVLDNLRSGKKENLNPQAVFELADIIDQDKVFQIFQKHQPEIVLHLAAQNEVPYSMEHPFEDEQINIRGTMNILESSRIVGVKKIVYSNTGGAFYGDVPEALLPIKEEAPSDKPTSFYGVSKHGAELYLKLYGNIYNIPWVSLRYSNVYGPRQEGNREAGIVAIFTEKLLKKEVPIIFGDGLNTRDYVYVSDVVDANIKALEYKGSDSFNISTGVRTSNLEVFQTIEDELKTGIKLEFGPKRPGDALHNSLDPKKAELLMGWKAETNFKTGVEKTVQIYRDIQKS